MTTVESLAPIAPPPSRLPNVGTTIFTVMSALAAEKQAVNLGQGFPDFDCDPRIVDAVSDAMRAGLNQYPPMTGVPALRQAIAAKVANLYGHTYDADREITITAGATQALLTTVLCCVHPGDEVIVFEPTYDSYIPSIELAGGKVVMVDYRPLPMPGREIIQSESRVILRFGEEYWAIERGRTLADKRKLTPADLPRELMARNTGK